MRRLPATGMLPATPWAMRRADDGYGVSARPDWRAVDWPAHLRKIEIGGARVSYVDLGPTGPVPRPERPVVFVHGLGGQWQNWLENIPRVAESRRVVALDLPGFGGSTLSGELIAIPGYGRCVDALCERLGLGRVDMVGNSMGGFIASEVAIQRPARVNRLVLVSAAGISSASVSRVPVLVAGRVATAATALAAGHRRRLARRPGMRYAALALVARHPGRLRADLAYEGYIKGAGSPGFHGALGAMLEYDFRERLPEIDRPTLIVWGQNDSIVPVRDAHEFERLVPDSRKVVMTDTGHISHSERPEAFNRLLLGFLSESGPALEREPRGGVGQAV